MTQLLRRLLRDDDGPTAVEYAVMLALVLAVAMVGIVTLSQNTEALWGEDQRRLVEAMDQ